MCEGRDEPIASGGQILDTCTTRNVVHTCIMYVHVVRTKKQPETILYSLKVKSTGTSSISPPKICPPDAMASSLPSHVVHM